MYSLTLLCTLLLTVVSATEVCYNDVEAACSSRPVNSDSPILANCNAKYGAIENLQVDLQAYANAHLEANFDFLLMSSHFGNYEANREGFKALYRKLSDDAWEKAIDIIKFITKRGGKMDMNQQPHFKRNIKDSRVLELNEVNSLARALDMEKQLAEEALRIHSTALHHPKQDAAVGHFIEEEFMGPQSETIRSLAGHTSDLKNLLGSRDASLSLFIFDEYLKKAV